MDTTLQKGKGICYSHVSQDDKHYFGGFLNLAQDNIDSVIQEFCTRTNLPYIKEKQNQILLDQYFKDNISHTDWERGINLLKEYWPVIQYIDLPITHHKFEGVPKTAVEIKKRTYFKKTLRLLFSAINDLRNYYTHYHHAPLNLHDSLFRFLDDTLFAEIIDVKKTKMKDDKTRQLLKDSLQEEIKKLYALKVEELRERKKKNSKINLNDKKAITNSLYNDAFNHLIYTNDGKEELANRYQTKNRESQDAPIDSQISMSGLVFLLSMFLSKKEVEQLKSNIEGYKGKVLNIETEVNKQHNSLRYMATHWVYSSLAFKGTKKRLTNTFNKESLLNQMVDELSKVPDEVYQTLSETSKQTFVEDINEYISESKNDETAPIYVVHPVIRKRYKERDNNEELEKDKFRYFAVRFLDEYASFPTLRFQIRAGQYLHDSRPKNIAGANLISQREIKENINVFGRLSEVVKLKNDFFVHNNPAESWELYPNPSYNWTRNNIPVYIDLINNGEKARAIQVHINQIQDRFNSPNPRSKRKAKKEIISAVFQNKVSTGSPTLILSNKELMALLYEFLVKHKTGAQIEDLIVKKIIDRYDLICGFEPGSSKVSKTLLPAKLQKSESGKESLDKRKLTQAIENELEIGNEKLCMIEQHLQRQDEDMKKANSKEYRFKSRKELRKHVFYSSELGIEATWIVNDLKRFMPVEARTNWKGTQHSELQKLIAFYATQRKEALQLIESVWDLNTDPHWGSEFKKVFNKVSFEDFYKAYITQRKEVLTGFLNCLNDDQTKSKIVKKLLANIFTVFDKRLYWTNSTEKQKEELLAKPFAFSRGLFDEKPTVVKGFKPQENPEKFADWYIYTYNYNGNFQSFYDMEREYTTLYSAQKKNGDLPLPEGKDEKDEFYRFKMDCDLQINQMKRQDIYTKLMVDKLYCDVFGQEPEFDLCMLYDSREERLENKALSRKVDPENGIPENNRNSNFLWNKTLTITLLDGKIVEPDVKFKDGGKLRKFVLDSKVKTLVSYDDDRIWNKLDIENELENNAESYEAIRRTEILKNIQQLEKYILQQYSLSDAQHPAELENNGYPNFRKYIANGILKRNKKVEEREVTLISESKLSDIKLDEIKSMSEFTQKATLLILLRNKFGHNKLPDRLHFDYMREFYPYDKQKSYSGYFNDVIQQIIEFLKTNLT